MKKTLVILTILAFVFLGCGKDNVKPSDDSLSTTEALNIINTVKTAYQEKDKDTLKNYLAPALAGSVFKGLFFEKAELSFTPKRVNINGSTVMVNLNWTGKWVIKGNNIKRRGVTVFVFRGSPMRLIRVDGDNPFLPINIGRWAD